MTKPNPDDYFGDSKGEAKPKGKRSLNPDDYFGPIEPPKPKAEKPPGLIKRGLAAVGSVLTNPSYAAAADGQRLADAKPDGQRLVSTKPDAKPDEPSAPTDWRGVDEVDAGGGTTPVFQSGQNPTAARGSVLDRPAVAAPPDRMPEEGMLTPEFVRGIRGEFGKIPPEKRFDALRELASGNGVKAMAARIILRDAEAENMRADFARQERPGMVDGLERAMAAPRVPIKAVPGNPPEATVNFPETGALAQWVQQRDAAGVASRHGAARAVADDQRSIDALTQRGQAAASDPDAKAFASENPMTSAVASGAANMLRGLDNIVPTVLDFASNLVGAKTSGAKNQSETSAWLERKAQNLMPEAGQQEMGAAWHKGEFGEWLMLNLAANAPQLAPTLVAAFVPGTQGAALGLLGGIAAGNKYADTGNSAAAVASGMVEGFSERLPLKYFERSAKALSTLPPAIRGKTVQAIGKALPIVGKHLTAQAIVGAIEEVVAQIGNNAIDATILEKDNTLLDGVAEAAVIGAFASGGLSLPQGAGAIRRAAQSPEQHIAQAIDQAASQYGLHPKAAATLRDKVAIMDPAAATAYAEKVFAAAERAGLVKKPGGGSAVRQNAKDLAAKAAKDAEAQQGDASGDSVPAGAAASSDTGLADDMDAGAILGTQAEAPQATSGEAPTEGATDGPMTDEPAQPGVEAGAAPPIEGEKINKAWSAFTPESGTLNIPREQMPQVDAEHRGALVNFLNARGITHESAEVPSASLKPTQAEFSPKKVEHFASNPSGRSILVSQDGYVLDGHHQWMAKRAAGEPVKVIRLAAPIQDLLRLAHQFPSSTTAKGPTNAVSGTGPRPDAGRTAEPGSADGGATGGTVDLVQGEQQQPAPAGVAGGAVPGSDAGGVPGATGPGDGNEALKPGRVGAKLAAGEVVLTASGRKTTPFPKLSFDTNRKATNTLRAVDQWLIQNALDEARSRGDNFNAGQFEQALKAKSPSQSDKDSAEEYLFGDQPAVVPSILRPLVPAALPTLTAGQSVTIDGVPYTVKSAKPKSLVLTDATGKPRTVTSDSATWAKVQPAEPNSVSDKPNSGTGPRILGKIGRTPNAAETVELRPNKDGTLTPHQGKYAMVDYETGEPVVIPGDSTNEQAIDAIKKSGAMGAKDKWFGVQKEQPDVVQGRAPVAQAQPDQEGAPAGGVEPAGAATAPAVPAAGSAEVEADGVKKQSESATYAVYQATESPAYDGVDALTLDDADFELEAMQAQQERGKLRPDSLAQSEFGKRLDTGAIMAINEAMRADPAGTLKALRDTIAAKRTRRATPNAAAPASTQAPAAPAVVPGTGSAAVQADGVKPTGPVIQNRDRSTPAAITQMRGIAGNPDYLRLSSSRDFTAGAPVIVGSIPLAQMGRKETMAAGKRRIPGVYAVVEAAELVASNSVDGSANPAFEKAATKVIAGNGRTAGLQEAYRTGKAGNYRAELEADESHGINPDVIRGMKAPVLVRVMPASEITDDIGDISNTQAGLQLSAVEQARNDANRVNLDALEFTEDGRITPDTVRRFVQAMPQAEQGNLINRDGSPTTQAVDRLNAVVFFKAYNSEPLTNLYAQTADPDARNIMSALAQAATSMARLEGAGALDIRPLIAEAAEIAINGRRNGLKLSEIAAQDRLDADPDTRVILNLFASNATKVKPVAEALKRAADFAYSEANKPADDMFGAVSQADRGDVVSQIGPRDEARGAQNLEEPAGGKPAGRNAEGQSPEGPGQGNAGAAEEGASAGQAEGLTLKAESEADAQAKAKREADALAAEQQAKADEQARLKREANKREADARAAAILAEREAAKKAEVDAAADDFALGQEPPKPVEKKVAAKDLAGQKDIFGEAAPEPTRIDSEDSPEVRQAKADLMAGLGELADLLGKNTRLNILPEQEQKLLPILTKVFDAAFRLGHLKFKEAAKFVLDTIRSVIGDDVADSITLDHLQGAYISMAGSKTGASTKREVVEVETLAELSGETKKQPAATPTPADGITRAVAGGQEGINGEWYEGGQILPSSEHTVKGEHRVEGPATRAEPAVDTSVATTPEAVLAGHGLVVEHKTAQSGKAYWAVSGNTREHEAVLDALGFGKPFPMGSKWYRSVRDGDPTAKLAAALQGNMPTPAAAPAELPSLPADEAAMVLRQFKVEVSQSGDQWVVTGKTFDIKDTIKATGGRWNGQAWAYTKDPTGTLAHALKERGGAGTAGDDAGTGDSDAEIARRRELRQREDARADERADAGDASQLIGEDTQALIRRGAAFGIPAKVLNDQIEDVGMIVNAHGKEKPLFLLANEAGTGKTMVLGGAIRELRKRGEAKFVYVTMNTDLIAQIKKDLNDYGLDGVAFHTYSELSTKDLDTEGAILIFDEAHNVKNVGAETARANKAQDLMAQAKMTVMASATLFENPVEARYLASTGIFDGVGGFSEWAKMYGASVKVRKFYNPNTGQQQTEEIIYWAGRGKKEDGAAARQWLFKQAIMTQRAMMIDPKMVAVQFRRNAVDAKWVEIYSQVVDAYDAATDAWTDEAGQPRDAKIVAEISRHRENTIKRILEASKVPFAISEAKDLLAAGRNVVIFVETKADRTLGKWRRSEHFKDDTLYTYDQMAEMMAEWELSKGMARMAGEKAPPRPFAEFIVEIARFFDAAGISYEMPSTADQITEALGADKVAMYTGAVTNTVAAKNKADFMSGRKPVLVATMAKGGTGLSLHDTKGDRPTTQLNINLPWKATGVDQVSARVARYGLASNAEVRWLFASNIPWESQKLAPRVGARMRDMGAIVKGIEVKAAEILDGQFDFEGDLDAKGGSAITAAVESGDIYARAKRMEALRRKADDTSNGFFETPYPLAALMAQIGGVRPGTRLLEPSAGRGNLLRLLPQGVNITAVELRQDNRDALARLVPDAAVIAGDFMEADFGPAPSANLQDQGRKFDTVLMNPPFERVAGVGAQDVAHVMRAYRLLDDGGRLVAIMGEGAFFRDFKQEKEFRQWLDDVGATVIQMPEGAFKQSGTGVRTRMVVIDKGGEAGRSDINLSDMEIESLRDVERRVPSRAAVSAAEAALPAETVPAEPVSQEESEGPTPNYRAGDRITPEVEAKETDKGVALNEPSRAYSAREQDPYETDLFGNPLPTPARAAGRGRSAGAGVRGNPQPEPTVLGDTAAPAGEYLTRTIVGVTTQREIGASVVKTAADAAAATAYLGGSAVERFDGLLTDKDGKPLALIGGFKGALAQAHVYPATLVGEALRVPGAVNLWLSHNHPSGMSALSRADEFLSSAIVDVFNGTGIKVRGILAIGDGSYSAVDEHGSPLANEADIPASKSTTTIPAIERQIAARGKQQALTSPAQAKDAARVTYDKIGGPGILLMSSQQDVIGWVPVSGVMRAELRLGLGGLTAIYRAISEANAGAAILAHGGELDATIGHSQKVANNIATALAKIDVRVLDIINVKTGASAAERGEPIANGILLSQAPAQPFYSALSRAIESVAMKQGTAGAWTQALKGMLASGKVKADELEWSGLSEFLNLQPGKVSKEQIAEYLAANGVRVTETVLSDAPTGNQRDRDTLRELGIVIEVNPEDPGMVAFSDEENPGDFMDAGEIENAGYPERAVFAARRIENSGRNRTNNAKYGQYTLPGGTNYREVLLTLPEKPMQIQATPEQRAYFEFMDGLRAAHGEEWRSKAPIADRLKAAHLERLAKESIPRDPANPGAMVVPKQDRANYRSNHWDQPNILAHIRVNDRVDADGKRVLFVEEIQSDWGQDGKKKGFRATESDLPERPSAYEDIVVGDQIRGWGKVFAIRGDGAAREWDVGGMWIGKEKFGLDRVGNRNARNPLFEGVNSKRVPAAPFVTHTDKWLALALKRVIKMAVDEGYDRVAFVNGEQSAERYDLSKQVRSIEWTGRGNDTEKQVTITPNSGNDIEFKVQPDGSVGGMGGGSTGNEFDGKRLDEIVGKDVAERILGETHGDMRGNGLKVGGTGMVAFYDKIVPAALKDVLKKVGGGQILPVEIGHGGLGNAWKDGRIVDNGITRRQFLERYGTDNAVEFKPKRGAPGEPVSNEQPGFDITPAMRSKAADGLPLFKSTASTTGTDPGKLTAMVANIRAGWADAPPVEVVATTNDLPANLVAELRRARAFGTARALIIPNTGQVYLIADRLKNLADAQFVLFHEVLGHYGLRKFLGADYEKTMRQMRAMNAGLAAASRSWMAEYGPGQIEARVKRGMSYAEATVEVDLLSVEEALADRAGKPEQISGFKRLVAKLQAWLREHGFMGAAQWLEGKTQAQVLSLLQSARDAVEKAEGVHAYTEPAAALLSQADQTDTPAFKRWFGASKVVDAEGKPLRVYHGTKAEFTEFKRTKSGEFGPAIYLTDNPREAGEYGDGKGWGGPSGTAVMPLYVSIQNPYTKGVDAFWKEFGGADSDAAALDRAQAAGYDGIIAKRADRYYDNAAREFVDRGETLTHFIAFRPEQIKSALGNSGAFDPSDPSILLSQIQQGNIPGTSGTEQEAITKGYKARVNRALKRVDGVINGLGELPDTEQYLGQRYRALGKIAAVDKIAGDIRAAFRKASQADKKEIYAYLTTAGANTDAIADPETKTMAAKVKRYIGTVGDHLVARGLISEESREAYRDAYLPRLYLAHLLSDGDWRAIGAGKKVSDMGYLKARKDIPQEIRDVILGEVKDPAFLAATAIAKPMRDMALLDWLAQISENQQWVLANSMTEWQGKRVSVFWLKAEADALRTRARHYPEAANRTAANAVAERMDAAAVEAMDGADFNHKDYKQIPNQPKYGRLRGIYVRAEIYNDLMGAQEFLPSDPGWAMHLLGYGGLGTKATQLWKMSKVALNIPGQVRNAISNGVMLQLSGVPFHKLPILMGRAISQIRHGGRHWLVAKKYGVTESTFQAQEMFRARRDLLDLERDLKGLTPLVALKTVGAVIADAAGDAYQFTEALFKTVKIMDAMEREGMDEEAAAIEAQKWLFDYSLVDKNVRYLRNAPVGMPFLTYTTKVLPRLAEVALLHPQRFLPWVALMYGMQAWAQAMFGGDDDEWDELKKALPKWMQEKGHVAFLPWRDDAGRLQAVDMSYFFPWSQWVEFASSIGHGDLKGAGKAMGLFGGPVTSVISAWTTGQDSFTGRQIINEGDPTSYQAASLLAYAWDLAMPPMMTSNGVVSPLWLLDPQYGGKLAQASTGATNRMGDQKATYGQAAARIAGFNAYGIDPEVTRTSNLIGMKADIAKARAALRSKLGNQGLTPAQQRKLIEDYTAEMAKRAKEMQKYAEESTVPDFARREKVTE